MNKPNVLIYRDLLLPASETFVKTQAEGLSDFTPVYAGFYKIKNGLDLDPAEQLHVMYKESFLNNRITSSFVKLPLLKSVLLPKIKKIKPVLVHAHFGPDGALALPIAQSLNVPYIVTFHGYDVTTKLEHLKKSISYNIHHYIKEMESLQQSQTLFIAASAFVKKKLIEKGFPEDKIIVHYIGVNLDLLHRDDQIKREDSIFFAGRLVENKGCEYLLHAMSIVNNKMPHVKLIIAGDGPLKHQLIQQAAELGINVEFLGKIPYEDVVKNMNKAKVFSVPSVEVASGASEGFGMVFAEAQAMGLPVASFTTGGIQEAVADGETGLLADPKDSKQLAENIMTLLNNDTLWKKFSEAGIQRVHKHFNLHKQNQKLEQIYKDVLNNQ